MNRRKFMRNTAVAGATAALLPNRGRAERFQKEDQSTSDSLPRLGPKLVIRGKKAVCSSQHPIVTEIILDVMKDGGNAADAVVAGSLAQATISLDQSCHAGTVTCLYWDAKTKKAYQLNSSGTLVQGRGPFFGQPAELGSFYQTMSCIPGYMPGLGALHERFATKSWSALCQPAIQWAEQGHPVNALEFADLYQRTLSYNTYYPSQRELFTPNGFVRQVGESFKNPKLAQTLRRLAAEGPEYFTKGDWAKHFVAEANRVGWPIKLKHMTAIPPRWQEPLRYEYKGNEIVQPSPPEQAGVFTAFVLGVLEQLGLASLGHYTKSAESLYFMVHTLRWANWEMGYLHDPTIFDVPSEEWLSKGHHKTVAEILRMSRPKIDLTEHVRLMRGNAALAATGLNTAGLRKEQPGSMATLTKDPPSTCSCGLSIADPEGNWVQMMHTGHAGGIPGLVVDGVPMLAGGNVVDMTGRQGNIGGWLVGGGRMRYVSNSTIVLKDGRPWLGLDSPPAPIVTPQILSNIIDFGMDPYEANVAPRMSPLGDDYSFSIESRIPESVVAGVTKMGILVRPWPSYHRGTFQICWRDEKSGLLNSCNDPRAGGIAGGY